MVSHSLFLRLCPCSFTGVSLVKVWCGNSMSKLLLHCFRTCIFHVKINSVLLSKLFCGLSKYSCKKLCFTLLKISGISKLFNGSSSQILNNTACVYE